MTAQFVDQSRQAAQAALICRSYDINVITAALATAGFSNATVNGDGQVYSSGVALTQAQMAGLLPFLPTTIPVSNEQ